MNKYERLKAKLAERGQILGTIMTMIQSAPMLELINEDYLDYVILDMEHGVYNNESIVPLLQTGRLIGLPLFVRIPEITYHHISRCLDLGADGVVLPRVDTPEQVALAIQSMRFPPIGKKGRGGYCQLRAGETTADFQKNRHLIVQIESPIGIQNLPEMLDRYGDEISAVLIGPYDLSFTMGIETQFEHPDFIAAVKRVFDLCIARGKSVGIFCDNAEQARKWRREGANFLWMCTDEQLMLCGLRTILKPMTDI